jgi:hypothetical protein
MAAGDEWLVRESEAEYRQKASAHLTSHALADFRKCPLLYHKKQGDLISDAETAAYAIGSALHTLVLEGAEVFKASYSIGGPINPKTGRPFGQGTRVFEEWAAMMGKPVITDDQHELVMSMTSSISVHPVAATLLAEGVAEGVVRVDYCGRPCQGRLDWFNLGRGIVDVKTCDDLTWFESDARRFGYAYQMAFYQALVEIASGDRECVHIIAIEKKEPFRCGVWRIGEDVLGAARKENETAIKRLDKCIETDTWPTGYEDVRVFDYL